MFENIFYVLLAILGLGFLVFIHEIGHYFMAKWVGMRIQIFSIGFGKPIFSWKRGRVKWQIGWLPFGGYVKIAGMQREGRKELYEIKDGFFGKKPIQRIKVALMGPAVNIGFALLAFSVIWLLGGRDKPFFEHCRYIGEVDRGSELHELGVRPGDEILRYDGRKYNGFKDLLYTSALEDSKTHITGYKVDYFKNKRIPFDYTLPTYPDPRSLNNGFLTIGVFSPARYLIYDKLNGVNILSPASPMRESGIKYGDRIVWVDGEYIFSIQQLSAVINDSTAFLTIRRDGTILHAKVPRVKVRDLKISKYDREEIDDWQHEVGLKRRVQDLYFLPYSFNEKCELERSFSFIDESFKTKILEKDVRNPFSISLKKGDKIIAIDSMPVTNSYELLKYLQTKHSLIIVEKGYKIFRDRISEDFEKAFLSPSLIKIVSSIGSATPIREVENFKLLNPIKPKKLVDFSREKPFLSDELLEYKKEIEQISSPEKRKRAMQLLESSQNRLVLGIALQDRIIKYNPNPIQLFSSIFKETWRTLVALLTGYLNPKWISGPLGIVQIVHHGWTLGLKEALFWLGIISMNLGIINLLPLPILDGGHIAFSLVEMVTKKPIKAKTMEKLIIPFIVLLIGFFIFITYQDLARLLGRFFK